jgi:Raf kinase inhibitor-like YbhB/YbcL family protein
MRQAFMLLGLMTCIVAVGAFFALKDAPTTIEGDREDVITTNDTMTNEQYEDGAFSLTAPSFDEGGSIPTRYTCDGENVSPELHIQNPPEGAVSFVLVMDDADIPAEVKERLGVEKFDHWALYNIPGDTRVLPSGEGIGTVAKNTRGGSAYTGPCPPDREHRYSFRLYALSGTLNFIQAPTLDEVETAAQGMSLGVATLTARYERRTQ